LGETLKDIRKIFGIKKYSTVGSVVGEVKRELKRNRSLRSLVEKLNVLLSKSQT
jgi:chromosomal replication initiation ATPase DnaA